MLITNTRQADQDIYSLRVMATKLSHISYFLFTLTDKSPQLNQVLAIELEKFHKETVILAAMKELTGPEWMQDKSNMEKFNATLGRLLSLGRVISGFNPKKYKALILKYLTMTDNGQVVFTDKNLDKLKKEYSIRPSRKAQKVITWSQSYAEWYNNKPSEEGMTMRNWVIGLAEFMDTIPKGMTWKYNGLACPESCEVVGKKLYCDPFAIALKY